MEYFPRLYSLTLLIILLCVSVSLADEQFTNPNSSSKMTLSKSPSATGGEEPQTREEDGLGEVLPLWSVIPFIGILLSIAIFPLTAEKFWHHHYGKVAAFWGLVFAIPFLITYEAEAVHAILHTLFLEYLPFIILLWSLFTVAGGILVQGAPVGTPLANLGLLVVGTGLASWIGTTGAAMVTIRPFIKMNKYRKSKVHLIVFFIFLVANIGGSLTPLGDPPLFLGFLKGVGFFWTFNLFPEMIFVVIIILAIFFAWDTFMFRREGWHEKLHLKEHHFVLPEDLDDEVILEEEFELEDMKTHQTEIQKTRMEIKGLFNLIFLLGVIGGVLFSGTVKLGDFTFLGIHMKIQDVCRDLILISMGLLSLKFTPWSLREGNEFTWFPIVEVAKLFAGIFVTIIPAIAMLQAGAEGKLGFIIETVREPWHYFWITGTLSAFLDNAPTYLVFLNTALGKFFAGIDPHQAVQMLIEQHELYLVAISIGAVFFGALTYIGNAPNFMVKSIAEQSSIRMPSFFGYMIYSVAILGVLFVIVTFVFLL